MIIYIYRLSKETKPGYKLEKIIIERDDFYKNNKRNSGFIYKVDPEVIAKKGKLVLFHIDSLIIKEVNARDMIHLDDYIKNTKSLIEKIITGKLDPTRDFEFKPNTFYYYNSFKDKELDRRVRFENIFPDDYYIRVWVARFLEQYMIYRTLYRKEKTGDDLFDVFFSFDNVARRYSIYIGFVPRIALIIGKNKKERRNEPIFLGKLDTPIDFLKVVIRSCEEIKKYLKKGPRLPEDIYKKLDELEQNFGE